MQAVTLVQLGLWGTSCSDHLPSRTGAVQEVRVPAYHVAD